MQGYEGYAAIAETIPRKLYLVRHFIPARKTTSARQSMTIKEFVAFSREWEGEKGLLLLLDGEPRSHVAEDLLLAAGFSFYRLQGDTVKQATYKTRPDGARGARGWAKTDLTPDQVREDPYALWL